MPYVNNTKGINIYINMWETLLNKIKLENWKHNDGATACFDLKARKDKKKKDNVKTI